METVLLSMPKAELQALISASVKDSVQACFTERDLNTPPPVEQDEILDISEAAKLVKLSIPSLYRLTGNNAMPSFRKGKKLLFSKKELVEWAMSGRRSSKKEAEVKADEFLGGVNKKRSTGKS